MSSTYNGAVLTIASTTNATPVVVTTTTPHGHTTGDSLLIGGTSGLIDGGWVITVLSSTTFSLNSSTAPGGTASTGSIFFYPPTFTIPGDGDAFNAAAFNVAYQALGDRTRYLANRFPFPQFLIITPTGTVTFPSNVTGQATIIGCGGGGGGGASASSNTTPTNVSYSGAGGGGSLLGRIDFTPHANHTYTATIGAGGTGAATNASQGGDGGDTTFVDTTTSTTIATFLGAMGGSSGPFLGVSGLRFPGGKSVRALGGAGAQWKGMAVGGRTFATTYVNSPIANGPGFGGDGMCAQEAFGGSAVFINGGWENLTGGFIPGGAGLNGTTSGSSPMYFGGGAGGGGGAGPFGNGVSGANGGNGNNSGTGGAGTAGSNAGANTGAGGAGAGAAGCGSTAGNSGAAGGNGGSGLIMIQYYVLPVGTS
jgi:hypothetical protein